MTLQHSPSPSRIALAALVGALSGCAATIDPASLEQRTATAIGQPVGSFTISERSEETGGRINYRVRDKGGATYQCHLYSATQFQRIMSFGQTPHSDAICTPQDGRAGGAPAAPACNALQKAAGRC